MGKKPTHPQEIYIKQHKKCVFWDYLQWPRRWGDRVGGGGGGWGPGGGGGGRVTDYFLENLFVLVM